MNEKAGTSTRDRNDIEPRFRSVLADNRAATMVEFALVAPIMFLFLFLIVDFGQLALARVYLHQALEEGSKVARTVINLEVDRRDFDITEIEFRRSVVARQKVIDAAVEFLGGTSLIRTTYTGTGNGGLIDLLDITLDESTLPIASGENPADVTAKVMLLLPGECATVVSKGKRITGCFIPHSRFGLRFFRRSQIFGLTGGAIGAAAVMLIDRF